MCPASRMSSSTQMKAGPAPAISAYFAPTYSRNSGVFGQAHPFETEPSCPTIGANGRAGM